MPRRGRRGGARGGGVCIVTADHGNAEQMLEPDGSPNTAHSLNPGAADRHQRTARAPARAAAILADVAPTVLELLGHRAAARR